MEWLDNEHTIAFDVKATAAGTINPGRPTICREDPTLFERTDALLRGLAVVLAHHSADSKILGQLRDQLHAYLDSTSFETVWLKRAKHVLTYPLAKYLRNEEPKKPDLVWKPAGSLRAWMRQRLTCFCPRNTHLWYSWFQAKRSTLPASDGIVRETYDDHFKTLTTADCGVDQTIDRIFEERTFVSLLERARHIMMGRLDDNWVSRSASGSACFENTRSLGGQQAYLTSLAECDGLHASVLSHMVCVPHAYGKGHNVVVELRMPDGLDEWSTLKPRAEAFQEGVRLNATIQAVLEPMKVRVISKGEALPYYSCRSLQKAMHGALRDLPAFRLIGSPFCPTDMVDLRRFAQKGDEWFSVDYSAATDGLSWKYSGRIFEFLIQDLSPALKARARAVLGPHRLSYPDGDRGAPVYRGDQQTGQLMGSILSFPLLCLANLGVYLLTTTDSHASLGLTNDQRLRHVLINGDDMLYAANPSLWARHVRIGEEVGLKMSVGKAYHHPVYANVNSTSVHYSLRGECSPRRIDYLNTGLFFGQQKVQGRVDCDSEEKSNGVVSSMNVLLQGSLPGERKISLLKDFCMLNARKINEECKAVIQKHGRRSYFTRNLFLPITSGGMGIDSPSGWKFTIKPIHQLVAASLIGRGRSCTQHPLPGYPVGSLDPLQVPWLRREKDDRLTTYRVSERKVSKARCMLPWFPWDPNPSCSLLSFSSGQPIWAASRQN